jgi:hypothetical protein
VSSDAMTELLAFVSLTKLKFSGRLPLECIEIFLLRLRRLHPKVYQQWSKDSGSLETLAMTIQILEAEGKLKLRDDTKEGGKTDDTEGNKPQTGE